MVLSAFVTSPPTVQKSKNSTIHAPDQSVVGKRSSPRIASLYSTTPRVCRSPKDSERISGARAVALNVKTRFIGTPSAAEALRATGVERDRTVTSPEDKGLHALNRMRPKPFT